MAKIAKKAKKATAGASRAVTTARFELIRNLWALALGMRQTWLLPLETFCYYMMVWSIATAGGSQTSSIGSNNGIMWGVNGHPVQGGAYTAISADQQMAQVASLGLKNYRIDLYDASSVSVNILQTFVAAGKTHGVEVLPILIPNFLSYANEAAAYSAGYTLGQTYASRFKADVHVWELGNEWDAAVGAANSSSHPDGSIISQYNQANYVLARGMLRGLLAGIHAADAASKGIVDTTGVCHYGFLDGLWNDGVHWDITGEHWYKLAGDITNMTGFCSSGPLNKIALLQSHYGKPIWISEFNVNDNPSDKNDMAGWLASTMTQWSKIAREYDIEGAQIYELYDQPNAPAGIEQHFGIADKNGMITPAGTLVQRWLAQYPSTVYLKP